MIAINASIVALIFIVLSLKPVYDLTAKIIPGTLSVGRANVAGIVLHGIVAGAVYMILLSMMKH